LFGDIHAPLGGAPGSGLPKYLFTMRRVYEKRIMSGCYSFEVLIGMHSADRSTDNNQSAQRREKNKSINNGTQIGYNSSSLMAL
jgi:hypothetical protein